VLDRKLIKMAGADPKWQKDAADQNFDYMFKLLIIGNSSVGKTSFLFRYADDSFTSAFVSTVGIDFKVKTVFRHDKRVKLQIWDTAGQERYRTITTAYYRGAMGFILMYDITNEESFNSVQDWVTQIKTYSWDNAQVILVGNKCDMEDERVISFERGKQLAEQLGVEFFETSAKENINVKVRLPWAPTRRVLKGFVAGGVRAPRRHHLRQNVRQSRHRSDSDERRGEGTTPHGCAPRAPSC
jgi:Ras-related protein Rab-3C